MDSKLKVLNTVQLIRINRASIVSKRSRILDPIGLDITVDPRGVHVISPNSFIHNDVEMRCIILLKERGSDEPRRVILDMSFEDYGSLQPFTEYQEVLIRK